MVPLPPSPVEQGDPILPQTPEPAQTPPADSEKPPEVPVKDMHKRSSSKTSFWNRILGRSAGTETQPSELPASAAVPAHKFLTPGKLVKKPRFPRKLRRRKFFDLLNAEDWELIAPELESPMPGAIIASQSLETTSADTSEAVLQNDTSLEVDPHGKAAIPASERFLRVIQRLEAAVLSVSPL